ncbi:HEPN domain-containing protein [Lamprobacter modestohalophilus]|nr:HEPN domain-containing protein [Lamprobacter modestohalophilus]
MSVPRDEAQQLLQAGERDRLSFQLLAQTGRAPHETLGFLAQQACEKFIKAVMVLGAVRVVRTHDLEYLVELAQAGGVTVPLSVQQLRQLNPYAVAFRYESSGQVWLSETEAENMVEVLHQWARETFSSNEV